MLVTLLTLIITMNYINNNYTYMTNTINTTPNKIYKQRHIKYTKNYINNSINSNKKCRRFHNIKQPGYDVQRRGHK